MDEELIGTITHYYGKIGVAVLKVAKGGLKIGDKIQVKGHDEPDSSTSSSSSADKSADKSTGKFEQEVNSMQVEHEQVQKAKKGDEVGLKVEGKVKEGDEVYRIIEWRDVARIF